ncbi:uncharacterized protein PRCAT00000709001 [Priceomyces carsonii]|uniref:uncharacterized protein n=1 Tax=Priceomyces carsonii TaxID=28549 RepID=UPI002ED78739|nr:unnamed protein product [Priceomyces carsonii]
MTDMEHDHDKRDAKRKSTIEEDFFSLSTLQSKKKKKNKKSHKFHDHDNVGLDKNMNKEEANISSSFNHSTEDPCNPKGWESPNSIDVEDASANNSRIRTRGMLSKKQLSDDLKDFIPEYESDDSDDETDILRVGMEPLRDNQENAYKFIDENERQRKYVIRVVSKMPRPPEYRNVVKADFGTKGTKSFTRIIDAILEYFGSLFEKFPDYKTAYDKDNIALIWVEGKREIKPFFKPSTLRIVPPPQPLEAPSEQIPSTPLTCLLIPKHNASNFLKLYPEFGEQTKTFDVEVVDIDSYSDSGESLVEYSDPEEFMRKQKGEKKDEEPAGEYFLIGLKGKDNKRIEVQVSQSTRIQKLLDYYIKVKGIKDANFRSAKVVFDDEDLDLDSTVGETELEEDFEVQIFI